MLNIAFLIGAALAAAAPADLAISIKEPESFAAQLREMGYAPDAFEYGETTAQTVIHLSGETLSLVLGGCTAKKNCAYAVVVGSFTDVSDPPMAFVAKTNADYDLIKVWVRDDKKLAYSSGAIVEGMPRASFRAWIEAISNASDALGSEAIKAGLGPKAIK